MKPKSITIIGVTGSIGGNALQVALDHNIKITLISCYKNVDKLIECINIIKKRSNHMPSVLCTHPNAFSKIKNTFDNNLKIYANAEDAFEAIERVDISLIAIPGISSLTITEIALKHSNKIALASKDSIICGWEFLKSYRDRIIPVDSEHSALYKIMKHMDHNFKKVMITASGGPFFNKTRDELKDVTIKDALDHPIWSMGDIITINSATLANKGIEVIEACKLFNIDTSKVDVVIHPKSIIHGAIYSNHGSCIAEMYNPNMRVPIMDAFHIAEDSKIPDVNFFDIGVMEFYKVNYEQFPIFKMAIDIADMKIEYNILYFIANEIAVNAFLDNKIKFLDIETIIKNSIQLDIHYDSGDTVLDIVEFYIYNYNRILNLYRAWI